jgi:hypothetical protein
MLYEDKLHMVQRFLEISRIRRRERRCLDQ